VYVVRIAVVFCLLTSLGIAWQLDWLDRADSFSPAHRLSGVGAGRGEISDLVLARRTELMIQSQTFGILRDPRSLAGAERMNSPKMRKLFEQAAQRNGLPASFLSAVAYLESWGEAKAQSPAGPRGIMQISAGTARVMGLKLIYKKRYRTVSQKQKVKRKGKLVTRTVRRRVPYTVLVRDERLIPSRAVPAAAAYLARLEERYGGRDWAVWAYHCGEGCTAEVRALAERADGLGSGSPSVARVFFGASPARNRDLYRAIKSHMERDWSPTYYFRIQRAEELLELHRKSPAEFKKLYREYRNEINPDQRAPHRLSVWLRAEDLAYKTCEDMRREQGRGLVQVFNSPKYFGFTLHDAIGDDDPANRHLYLQASPAAVGTIAYIAFETRRLHEAMNPRGERFVPLQITSLVRPLDRESRSTADGTGELPTHCTGQVFDLDYGNLPAGQREALDFVLDDMGWSGYLGFVRKSAHTETLHIGAAPTARQFFSDIYQEAVDKVKTSD
jgi:hypothetical protein